MKAVAYVRLSRLTDQTTSPERQRRDIEAMAEARGYELTKVYEDLDISAFSGVDRPGLAELLDNLDGVDAVIVWKLDRLARNVRELLTIAETLKERGVALVSVKEGLDLSGPIGTVLLALLGSIAQMESESTSVRVASAQAHLRRQGLWSGGRRPFGWKAEELPDGHKRLVLDPVEAPVVVELVERILGGEGVTAITRDFNERGLPAPELAGRWNYRSARAILDNRRLIGEALDKSGAVIRGDDGLPVIIAEPLLDRETFDRLQAVLEPTRGSRRRRGDRRLLSGIAVCAGCGGTMHGSLRSTRYLCPARANGTECSENTSIFANRLDEYVEAEFLAAVGRLPVTEPIQHAADLHAEERQRLNDALDELAEELASGAISPRVYGAAAAKVEARLESLPEPGEAWVEWRSTGTTFAEEWERRDVEGRRSLIASALDRVVVRKAAAGPFRPERVSIEWRERPEA